MKPLNIIIIDDEQPARDNLKNLLTMLYANVNIIAEADCYNDALEVIEKQDADIIFLDINLRPNTSFTLLDNIKTDKNLNIVFVTAHENFALKAFKYKALDYLLKPVGINQLKATVDRIMLNKKNQPLEEISDLLKKINLTDNKKKDNIVITDKNGWQLVPISNIIYLEAAGSYCKIFLNNGKQLLPSKSLKHFEEILVPTNTFLKIHKSFMVNKNAIVSYNSTDRLILLQNNKSLPVALSAKEILGEIDS